MAAKTTSSSGFLLIFMFSTLDLLENGNNLKTCSGHFFENFEVKLQKILMNFKSYKNFPFRNFLIFCSDYGPVLLCINSATFDQ